MATVQGSFVALFGRPADPLGLQYYQANPAELKKLQFSDEYLDRFKAPGGGTLGPEASVTKIYNDLLGRNPDPTGLAFYVTRLNSGEFTINDVAVRILDGATGSDAQIIANKLTAADAFTSALSDGNNDADEVAAYNGQLNPFAIPLAQDYLSGITADPATIPSAQAAIDQIVSQDTNPQTPGGNFSLKAAPGEIVDGTAGNDVFSGVRVTTWNTGDLVDGKGGDSDMFNIVSTAAGAVPAGTSVKNVEIINITASAVGAAITGLDASFFQGATQVWQIADANAIVGVGAGVTAGFKDTIVAAGDSVKFTTGAGLVAFNNVTTGATLTSVGASATTKLTDLTLSGSIATTGVVAFANGANSAVKDLHLDLTSAAKITANAFLNALTTFDADGSDSGVTVSFAGNTKLASSTFGDGKDTVTLRIDTAAQTSSLGKGSDVATVSITSVAADKTLSVDLGSGDGVLDKITVTGSGNINTATAAGFDKQLLTIDGFDAATDFITFIQGGTLSAQNLVNGAVAGAATLFDAVDAVAKLAAGSNAQFVFGGDLYLFRDADAGVGGLNAADSLVKVTGAGLLSNGTNGDLF